MNEKCQPAKLSWIANVCFALILLSLLNSTVGLISTPPALAQGETPFATTAVATETPELPETTTEPVPDAAESFEITLQKLNYRDHVLKGPLSSKRYYFSTPANWDILTGSQLLLNLNYDVALQENQESYAPALLEIQLNGQVLYSNNIKARGAFQLAVSIPPRTLVPFENANINSLQISLLVRASCEEAQLSSLSISASSSLQLVYLPSPLPLDLALYPKPLYQPGSLESNPVNFLLPSEPSLEELQAATMIAARLGRLSGNNLVISTTLASDIDFSNGPREHLVIIGLPENIPVLDGLDLPLRLTERRLFLQSKMPTAVIPGNVFSYTLSVKNTEQDQTLSVEDYLPSQATLLSCSGECRQIRSGLLRWQIGTLQSGQEISTVVRLYLDQYTRPGERVEHTTTLLDEQRNPINVDTIAATAALTATNQVTISNTDKGKYFFVQDNLGIAENDGIIQELVSPWNPNSAVVVVTGLDVNALRKASQALSSETRFPGMKGTLALAREVQKVTTKTEPETVDISFADLGYSSQTLQGTLQEAQRYTFNIPWGWSLTEKAFMALHFAHGAGVPDKAPTLEIELNNVPVGSTLLLPEDTTDKWLTVPLPTSSMVIGSNHIDLKLSYEVDWCIDERNLRTWLTVYTDSFFHLPREQQAMPLDLSDFPQPFTDQPNLKSLVFLLPTRPTATEIQDVIRLSAKLGYAAGGNDFEPQIALGGNPKDEQWPGHHLVLVGRQTANPYLAAINNVLPQPFRPNSDEIEQKVNKVIYRLEPETSLGFVQELLAPWNDDQVILVATGTTDTGVEWALNALIDDNLTWRLYGDLALIREREVQAIDLRQEPGKDASDLIATVIPEATPEPTSIPSPTPSRTPTPTFTPVPITATSRPSADIAPFWLLPLLVLSIIVAIGAAIIAVWKSRF